MRSTCRVPRFRQQRARRQHHRCAVARVVSQIFVAVGDAVEKGSAVLQMEAMKLVHTLTAPVSGHIAAISCMPAITVPAGAVLVEIVSADGGEKV